MTAKSIPFDSAEHFRNDPQRRIELILDAVASGDALYMAHVLGVVARAQAARKPDARR